MKINITRDDRYKLHIAASDEMVEGHFNAVYRNAFSNLTEIVGDSIRYSKGKNGVGHSLQYYQDVQEPNTIISFVGDRGAGKSSAMLSFVESLRNPDTYECLYRSFKPFDGLQLDLNQRLSFTVMPIIDPTRMNDQDTILSAVAARMVAQVSDKEGIDAPVENRRDFYLAAETLFSDVKTLQKPELFDGDLSTLEDMADLQRIRKHLHNLVMFFLKIMQKSTPTEYSFLVIPVDDLDMNMKNAMRIAEEMRKYFMIPNVIITIAMSVAQLTHIVEQEFRKGYETMLTGKRLTNQEPYDMAVKYINKLLPAARRNYLPKLEIFSYATLLLDCRIGDDKKEVEHQIVDYLLGLIYRKTGMLLMKDKHSAHAILPNNLRSLMHLIFLLEDMPDVDVYTCLMVENSEKTAEAKAEAVKLVANLEVLENYIVTHHGNSIGMDSKDSPSSTADLLSHIISSIPSEPTSFLNAFIVQSLASQLPWKKDDVDRDPCISDIFAAVKKPLSLSVGDVLYVLGHLVTKNLSREIENLVSIIFLLYSIRLMRLYFLEYAGKTPDAFRELIGGFLFEPDSIRFVMQKGDNDWRRDCDVQRIQRGLTVEALLEEWAKTEIGYAKIGKQDILRVMEHMCFFIPCFGKLERKPWRLYGGIDELYYETSLSDYERNVGHTQYFSINYMACFTNSLAPFQTCNRLFDGAFPNLELTEETALKLHSDPGLNAFSFSNMLSWQKTHHFILPLYSMDFIRSFFDSLRKYYLKSRKKRIANDTMAIKAFWSCVHQSLDENLNIVGVYTGEAFKNKAKNAFAECPLYKEPSQKDGDDMVFFEKVVATSSFHETQGIMSPWEKFLTAEKKYEQKLHKTAFNDCLTAARKMEQEVIKILGEENGRRLLAYRAKSPYNAEDKDVKDISSLLRRLAQELLDQI